jgi:transposase InsO family protein
LCGESTFVEFTFVDFSEESQGNQSRGSPARAIISDWKQDYNQRHRHSRLGYLTVNEYAQISQCMHISKVLK